MKRTISLSALLLALWMHSGLFATDYYWIGGSGIWTDLNHWATTSGGSANPFIVPGASDNVFFDQNSGFLPGSQVSLTGGPHYCKTMDWRDIRESVTFQADGDLFVYGSLYLDSLMTLDWGSSNDFFQLEFRSQNTGNQVDFANLEICGSGDTHIEFLFTAKDFELLSDILGCSNRFLTVYADAEAFHSNSHFIRCNTFAEPSGYTNFQLGSSRIEAKRVEMVAIHPSSDLSGAQFYCSDFVVQSPTEVQSLHMRKLIPIRGLGSGISAEFGLIADTVIIYGGSDTDIPIVGEFEINDYFRLQKAGTVIRVGSSFIFRGDVILSGSGSMVNQILGPATGTMTIFDGRNSPQCQEFVFIQGIEAIPSANHWFAGQYSSDLGNNSGWEWNTSTACEFLVNAEVAAPEKAKNFTVFPNPAGDLISLDGLESLQTIEYTIFDMTGKRMLAGSWTGSPIDISGLPKGVFLMRVNRGDEILTRKFVRQ